MPGPARPAGLHRHRAVRWLQGIPALRRRARRPDHPGWLPAHVRRKFYEAREQAPRLCAWLLGQFQQLYRLEAQLRESRAGPALRQEARQRTSRPVMERLQRVLRKLSRQRRFLPRSSLGLAIAYALECWPAVSIYLRDGRVEIDNNLVENAIRPTALGKKNWLFIGEAEAGERSAILYTIVESCRRRGLDPFAYLRDVLERLPNSSNHQVKNLTPEAGLRREPASLWPPLHNRQSAFALTLPICRQNSTRPAARQEALGVTLTIERHFRISFHNRSGVEVLELAGGVGLAEDTGPAT